jgi:alpha-ribazole phosphatase/probable phosphoglycerate mutase
MATTVYLIRHGETVDADSRRYKGHIDVPLSENGIKQLQRLAEYLTQITDYRSQITDIKAVYSSGLDRSLKSAEIIAKPFGLKPDIIDDLKERSFGAWEGMTFDEIKDKWPDAFNAWAENPLKFSPMEGENTLEVKERAMKAFYNIINKHKDEEIAIVSHGGITRVVLCEMLGMPLENIFRIEQDFAALNIIEIWDYPVVKLINARIE